jgi:hypothetical protein
MARSLAASATENVGGVVVSGPAAAAEGGDAGAESGALIRERRLAVAGRRSDGAAVRLELMLVQRGSFLYQGAVVAAAPEAEAVDTFFDGVRTGVLRGGAEAAPASR